ncbi:hypothetical protein AHAT_22960 [Agarivorans sp. Toyoura001]|nr:hypothetical protein AHAT_22960 [Agarivorans sp. Toyoura001]
MKNSTRLNIGYSLLYLSLVFLFAGLKLHHVDWFAFSGVSAACAILLIITGTIHNSIVKSHNKMIKQIEEMFVVERDKYE